MTGRIMLVALGLLVGMLPGDLRAQALGPVPPPASCEDELRAAQLNGRAATFSQVSEREQAARHLAASQKALEQAQRTIAELTAKLKAKETTP